MKKILPALILFASLLQVSCSTDSVSNATTQNAVDVYVAGQKDNQACYWKNNQPVMLDSGGMMAPTANKIIVVNNDIYVLGLGLSENSLQTFPLFWKNGVLSNLTTTLSTNDEIVTNITDFEVVGNDVYFVGYTKKALIAFEDFSLAYWKNGVKSLVHNYGGYAFNYAKIKIAGSNVYVTATANGGETVNGYYLNTIFTEIPNSKLNGLAISNNEMYVYGKLNDNTGYYKNINTNSETTLPTGVGEITQLLFDNNNMYFSNGSHSIYKNGTLFDATQELFGGIMDFKILNNNVYKITQVGDFGFTSYLTINGVETMQVQNSEGSFLSLFVVQN